MGLQWYPKFPGDYARDTAHLTMLEHGAYTLLLDYYYSTAKPLPANEDTNAPTLVGTSNPRLYRICRAVNQEEQKAVDMVIEDFFTLIDGKYHQGRADTEIEKRVLISEKRKLARASRGKKDENKDNKNLTNVPTNEGTSVGTHEDTTTTTTTTTNKKKEVYTLEFLQFWDSWKIYKTGKGSKSEALPLYEQTAKEIGHAEIIRSSEQYCKFCRETDCNTKHVFRWLKKRGWEDDYTITPETNRKAPGEKQCYSDQVMAITNKAKELLLQNGEGGIGENSNEALDGEPDSNSEPLQLPG